MRTLRCVVCVGGGVVGGGGVVKVEGREEGCVGEQSYCLDSDLNLQTLDRKSSALTTPSL